MFYQVSGCVVYSLSLCAALNRSGAAPGGIVDISSARAGRAAPRPCDGQLLHARKQRGPLHAQDGGRPVRARDLPAGAFEYLGDIVFLDLGQGLAADAGSGLVGRQGQDEASFRAQDSGALDGMLELADIPRPAVSLEAGDIASRNAGEAFAQHLGYAPQEEHG